MTTRARAAALADQGLLAIANLLAFIIFARALGPESWGLFAFAHAAALFVQGFQRATVVIPLVTFRAGRWLEDWPSWRAQNVLATLAALAVALLACAGAAWAGAGWLVDSLAMAAVVVAPLLLQEFARRSAIQEQRFGLLVAMAAAYATVCVGAALALPWLPWPAWVPALGVAAASCAAVLVHAVSLRRWPLARPGWWSPGRDYPSFARWSSASHVGFSGYNFGIQSVLAATGGPAAVGVFHACRILVQPINTLIGATDSVDKPRAARALAQDGFVGMRRVLGRSLTVLLALGLPYLLIIAATASWLLPWLLGEAYRGQTHVVTWWCAVALAMLIAQPVESGLYVTRRVRQMFHGRLLASALGLGLAWLLAGRWGAAGALVAMVAAYLTTASVGLMALRGGRPLPPAEVEP